MKMWPRFEKAGFRVCIVEPPGQPRVAVIDPFTQQSLSADNLVRLQGLGFKPFGEHGRLGMLAKKLSTSVLISQFDGEMAPTSFDDIIIPKPASVKAKRQGRVSRFEATPQQAPAIPKTESEGVAGPGSSPIKNPSEQLEQPIDKPTDEKHPGHEVTVPSSNEEPAPEPTSKVHVPVLDARALEKSEQARKAGRESALSGAERDPPEWMEEELADDWLQGFGEGIVERAKLEASGATAMPSATSPDVSTDLAVESQPDDRPVSSDGREDDGRRTSRPSEEIAQPQQANLLGENPATEKSTDTIGSVTASGVDNSPADKPTAAISAEEKIRAAFEELPNTRRGVWYPMEVEHNGTRREFLAQFSSIPIVDGPTKVIHLINLRVIAVGKDQTPAIKAFGYRLNRDNVMLQEAVSFATHEVMARWEEAGFDVPALPTPASSDHELLSTQAVSNSTDEVSEDDGLESGRPVQPAETTSDGALGGDSAQPPADVERGAPEHTADGEPSESVSVRHRDIEIGTGGTPDHTVHGDEPATKPSGNPGIDAVSPSSQGDGRGGDSSPSTGTINPHRKGLTWQPSVEERVETIGAKQRALANLDAVAMLHRLGEEGRSPSPDERKLLARYSGWGGCYYIARQDKVFRSELERLKDQGVVSEELIEGWERASADAFYTPYYLTEAMWELVQKKGFKGGHIGETSAGTGRFLATMPQEIVGNSFITAVEKEHTSGRILSHLYGDSADVRVAGYEQVYLPSDTLDLAIGNIPFGSHQIHDRKELGARPELIHDYFILKTLKKLKPGGVMAFITSTGTLDKADTRVRKRIAESADLMGAVRLPAGIFSETTNTDVSSDIVVFRKRFPGQEPGGLPFIELNTVEALSNTRVTVGGQNYGPGEIAPMPINEVFANNPSSAGGGFTVINGRFGPELRCLVTEADLVEEESPFERQAQIMLDRLSEILPDNLFAPTPPKTTVTNTTKADPIVTRHDERNVVVQGFFIHEDGTVHLATNLSPDVDQDTGRNFWRVVSQPVSIPAKDEARVLDLVRLRDQASEHLNLEASAALNDHYVEESRSSLNGSYDKFVEKHGFINEQKNRKWALTDAAGATLFGLERWNEEKKTALKADVFTKRVIKPATPKDTAETLREAAVLSFSRTGQILVPEMARLLGKGELQLLDEIQKGDDLYLDPDTSRWLLREHYLSGNVRERLVQAESCAKLDPMFERNVKALEDKVPEWVPFESIHVNLGSTWVPTDVYRDFLKSLLPESKPEDFTISYVPAAGQWIIRFADHLKTRHLSAMCEIYGTEDYPLNKVFEAAVTSRSPVITRTEGAERYKDVEASLQAQIKVDQLKESFLTWLANQEPLRNDLETQYNERFNCFNFEEWDGSSFEFPGLSPLWEPRTHQANAVFRGLMDGNTLFAHCVGAGKTMEQVMLLMESRRLGLLNKPALAVPNHLLLQTASAVKSYYPLAKVLVVEKGDLSTKEKRKAFSAKVAMNEWDIVVLTHSQLPKLRAPRDVEISLVNELIDEYEGMLSTVSQMDTSVGGRNHTTKSISKRLQEEKNRLKMLIDDRESNADAGLDLRQLGIDGFAVDESHLFKNLEIKSSLNIPGLTNSASQRAMDLFIKSRYLMDLHGGERGLYFFTGTPIANSISEMYTVHRYLRPSVYEDAGAGDFASWVSAFGEVTRNLEILPEGSGFQLKERLSRFHNLPELLTMFRTISDVKTKEDLNLPTPNVKTEIVVAEKSHWLSAYMLELASRAKKVRDRIVKPNEDNLLKISGDGRKASLDMAMINPLVPREVTDKVSLLLTNVEDIYRQFENEQAAQLVFCDLGTPKTGSNAGGYSVYQTIKDDLIARGVPASEIAFMQDAKTDAAKGVLQQKVRDGSVRILIGSTETMGTGLNVQDRLIALHNLDCPWRPDQLEQRIGRIERQGNQFDEVMVFNYTTEDSFDLFMWETVRRKARFIAQGMSDPRSIARSLDEDSDLSYAQVVALTTGDPLIGRKVEVDAEVMKLERMEAMHNQKNSRLEKMLKEEQRDLQYFQARYDGKREVADFALSNIRQQDGREFTLTVTGPVRDVQDGDTTWLSSAGARAAFAHKLVDIQTFARSGDHPIGTFVGFDVVLTRGGKNAPYLLGLQKEGHEVHSYRLQVDEPFSLRRFSNWLADIPSELKSLKGRIDVLEKSVSDIRSNIGGDDEFAFTHKLEKLIDEQRSINEELERKAAENTQTEEFSFEGYAHTHLIELGLMTDCDNPDETRDITKGLELSTAV